MMQFYHFGFYTVHSNVFLIVRPYLLLVLQLAIHDLSRGACRLENGNVPRCSLAVSNVMLHECLFGQCCLWLRPNTLLTHLLTPEESEVQIVIARRSGLTATELAEKFYTELSVEKRYFELAKAPSTDYFIIYGDRRLRKLFFIIRTGKFWVG